MENADLVSPEFLAHRLRRVLRLLRTHAEHIRTAPVGDSRADRAACDTVLLCAKLSRNGHLEGEEGVDGLLDVADARLRSDAMVASLVWRPGLVPCLAMATTLLNELGRGDPRFDVLPLAAWDTSFRESAERRPHEVLEARWSARHSGAGDDVRIPDTSLLLRKPFAPMTEAADLGAYARSLYCVTDFGRDPLPAKPLPRDVWDVLDAAVTWTLFTGDPERLAELLLAAVYAGMPPTPAFRAGLCALMVAWDDRGFVAPRGAGHDELDETGRFFSICRGNTLAALLCSELIVREFHWPLMSGTDEGGEAEELLASALGPDVARRIAAHVGPASMQALEGDLRVARGFARRDIEDISRSLRSGSATWAIRCAAEWLAMVKSVAEVTRRTDHAFAATGAQPASTGCGAGIA
ncbi:hypothetical protein DSM104443_02431 [Usitatibacter rugosus]|uniref:DUF6895 domain-containing protein n=1 Tax=Usitatibacter rugosus TaxID=2732067 RepID=A0A6M4GVZ3_9PROT|nr:hypothetical protein [Usitatibacter rugosus]QJR11356.1 hypothetical protein DSM104443_02431 [Usitatibacter rugosus]